MSKRDERFGPAFVPLRPLPTPHAPLLHFHIPNTGANGINTSGPLSHHFGDLQRHISEPLRHHFHTFFEGQNLPALPLAKSAARCKKTSAYHAFNAPRGCPPACDRSPRALSANADPRIGARPCACGQRCSRVLTNLGCVARSFGHQKQAGHRWLWRWRAMDARHPRIRRRGQRAVETLYASCMRAVRT